MKTLVGAAEPEPQPQPLWTVTVTAASNTTTATWSLPSRIVGTFVAPWANPSMTGLPPSRGE